MLTFRSSHLYFYSTLYNTDCAKAASQRQTGKQQNQFCKLHYEETADKADLKDNSVITQLRSVQIKNSVKLIDQL